MTPKKTWPNLLAWLSLGLLGITHIYLISKTFFVDALGNFRTSFTSYGDIPLHLTQISKFAFGKLTDLGDPIFYGAKLQYPFMLNFISGLLLKITQNWELAVLAPAIILCAANITLLLFIYKRFFKSIPWAALAIIVFFLGSGWDAYPLISQAVHEGQSPTEFFQYLADHDISIAAQFDAPANQQNIDFGAPLNMSFLHQRTFFLGLFGFLLVWLLALKMREKNEASPTAGGYTALFGGEAKPRTKGQLVNPSSANKSRWSSGALGGWLYPILAGIILGLMPLWHAHSFIAALILIAAFFILAWQQKDWPLLKRLCLTLAIGAVLAIPQGLYLISSKDLLAEGKNFIQLRLGWMIEPAIGSIQFGNTQPGIWNWRYLEFLWLNFGIILPVFLAATGALLFKRFRRTLGRTELRLYLAYAAIGLICFAAVQTIQFQPWDFDNNKLLVYWQLLAVPVILLGLKTILADKKMLGLAAVGVFAILATTSGVVDTIPKILKDRQQMPVIFDITAQEAARFIRENINEDDLILTGTSHLNPVASLAGRPILVGYPGWLWTRGIEYQARYDSIKKFYQSPRQTSELLKEYPIKYILFDNNAQYEFSVQRGALDSIFAKVFGAEDYVLYKI